MARIFLAFLVFGMVVVTLKVVLVAIILAGLIWRPKETLGALLIFGLFALLNAFPVPTLAIGGTLGLIGIYKWLKSPPKDDADVVIEGQLARDALPAPEPPDR